MSLRRVASVSDLTVGSLLHVENGAQTLALCNHQGTIRAFHGLCPHVGGPLGQGNLDGEWMICPWHAWEFDCRSGELAGNANVRLPSYPVKIVGDDVFVDLS